MENKLICGKEKQLIGMIHVPALPGTPFNKLSPKEIVNTCITEASIYSKLNIDSIMIENMHDIPYLKRKVGPEITSMMTIISYEVKKIFNQSLGIQILAGANQEAISVANSVGLDYIRAEGFVFAHVADEGIMQSDAGELLRFRKSIGADNIKVYTDIKKKHSANFITSDVSIVDMAKNAEFFGSDGVIITGNSTGEEASVDDIMLVNKSSNIPVLIGSGLTYENIDKYFPYAQGFIVGTHFKKNNFWKNELDEYKITNFIEKFNSLKR